MRFWSDKSTAFSETISLHCGNKVLTADKPLVMGILNLTPDSFYDGGKYSGTDAWLAQTEKMVTEGASIIDLGAVSTRPGAAAVSEDEELQRLLPVLGLLTQKFKDVVFSVDTFRAKVAQLAAQNGAGIINDISAGKSDPGLIESVAQTGLPYILMHMQGTPQTMQHNPTYHSVVNEVDAFFNESLQNLSAKGIGQIIIDPGFGFGKSIEHNYALLKNLHQFKKHKKLILAGVSRKSMLYKPLGITPAEALNATTAINMIAILNGADILRVHDVKEAFEAIKLAKLYTMALE